MILNLIKDWYTDSMTIYRVSEYQDGSITKQRREIVRENIPCRIAKRSKSGIKMTDNASENMGNDLMVCDNAVDVRSGDELEVIRGGMLGHAEHKTRYFAGDPDALYTPFGGVTPGIDHQEIPLFAQNRVKKG